MLILSSSHHQEMKTGCARAMEQAGLVHTLTDLFIMTHSVLASASTVTPTPAPQPALASPQITPSHAKDKDKDKDKDKESSEGSGTPKWLSPGLLLLDLYEKLAIATKRRAAVHKVSVASLTDILSIFRHLLPKREW